MKYLLFHVADNQQDDIWHYTLNTWGESQAKKYIIGLHDCFQAIADKKLIWRLLPQHLVVPQDLSVDVYFVQYEKHHIFFKQLSGDTIGILAILHESMNMPIKLAKDLEKLLINNKH